MTSLLENGHKSDDLNNSYSVEFDTHSGLTLDNIVNVLITGYFNGYNVEIRLKEEMSLLYQMGQFGNEFSSNSKSYSLGSQDHNIMRKRQFLKRTTWYNKFQDKTETQESCKLLNDIRKLTEKIVSDGNKNVIDLVSSDESDTNDDNLENNFFHTLDDHELVVVVPNSDSEGENYFENFKPKCCANRIKTVDKLILSLQEAYFLAYVLGCLQIINLKDELLSVEQCWKLFNEIDCLFTPKYIVYHYFKAKGYCVKPGIKFGGDYLLYQKGPNVSHADYIVVIQYDINKYEEDWVSLLGHVRMAATTVKEIILVEVVKNREPTKIGDLGAYSVSEVLLKRKLPLEKEDSNIG